jgi:hypothetical protein
MWWELGILAVVVLAVCLVEAMVSKRPGGDLTGEKGNVLWRELRRRER